MKQTILTVILSISFQSFAGNVEIGKYTATAKDNAKLTADFELKSDGRTNLALKAEGQIIKCTGTYSVTENIFKTSIVCNHPVVPSANVSIDITNVTAVGLRSTSGVEVPVRFDLIGDDPVVFMLKKID